MNPEAARDVDSPAGLYGRIGELLHLFMLRHVQSSGSTSRLEQGDRRERQGRAARRRGGAPAP